MDIFQVRFLGIVGAGLFNGPHVVPVNPATCIRALKGNISN